MNVSRGAQSAISASADALKAAHLDALQKLRTTATDSRHQQELDRAIATLKAAK